MDWAERITVLAPHPDDEVIGVGGLLHRAGKAGSQVEILLGSWRTQERLEEAEVAARILGVARVTPLFESSADEIPERQLVSVLEGLLNRTRPDLFLIPENAVHPEHRAWFRAAIAATRPSATTPLWRPRHVWCWEAPADQWGGSSEVNTYVPLSSADVEVKVQALRAHASQLRNAPSERSEFALRSLAALRGVQTGAAYAEAFRSLRDEW